MQKHPDENSCRLITIPISHYCEKARWGLERLEINWLEEPHPPLFHRLATSQSGKTSVHSCNTDKYFWRLD